MNISMDETNNLAPRERPLGGPGDSLQTRSPFLALDLMPREPHLLDYLIVLRKHQWLILFFLLTIVSIVTIATFRMQPVYEATARVEIDRENNNAIHFSDSDSYDMYEDLEDYITTQSKILTERDPGDADGQVHGARHHAAIWRRGKASQNPHLPEVTPLCSGPRPWARFSDGSPSSVCPTAACWM